MEGEHTRTMVFLRYRWRHPFSCDERHVPDLTWAIRSGIRDLRTLVASDGLTASAIISLDPHTMLSWRALRLCLHAVSLWSMRR